MDLNVPNSILANRSEITLPPMSLASLYRQVYVREPGNYTKFQLK